MLLPLPTTPEIVLRDVMPQAMALLPKRMRTPRSDVELLTIGLQESALDDRRQGTLAHPGPARGLLQFEQGGVAGVVSHGATRELLRTVCTARGVAFDARSIHLRLEFDDVLAFALGRLLLWTDPLPLPGVGDTAGGFDCYVRNWRPGAARTPEGREECWRRWQHNYPRAFRAVQAAS